MSQTGILLAFGSALLANISLLCKHRGAVRAPDVRFGSPLASAASLFRSRWWTIGFIVAAAAWLLHVAALSMAPLSAVQAVIAAGLVLLVVPAREWFGITLGRREMAGIGLSAVGLALLALTASPETGSGPVSSSGLVAFEGAAIAVGVALLLSGSTERAGPHRGVLLAAAAGILLGVANVAVKGLADAVPAELAAIVSPWALVAVLAGVGAFFALARSLQVGSAIEVIVISSVAVNVAAIMGGVYVYGDSMGSDTLGIALRSAAFAAVISAAALVPSTPRSRAAATA